MSLRGQITDADLYNDEKELLGVVKEFKIPSMEITTIEQEGLGSVGVLKLPSRGLSALEGTLKLLYPEQSLLRAMNLPTKVVSFQLHEKLDIFNPDGFDEAESTVLITHVRAMFSKVEGGDSKKGEAREVDGEFSATYLMQRYVNSETPLFEVDLFNNIYRVNGKNVWSH